MNIELYQMKCEKNKVNKTADLILTHSLKGTLKTSSSVQNPNIIVELKRVDNPQLVDNNNLEVQANEVDVVAGLERENVINCNYAYIVEFNRYYFIDEIISIKEDLWLLNMSVDVLMTYRIEIGNQRGVISRNEFEYDRYVEDKLVDYIYDKQVSSYKPYNISPVDSFKTSMASNDYNILLSFMSEEVINRADNVPSLGSLPSVTYATIGANLSTGYRCLNWNQAFYVAREAYKRSDISSYIKNIIAYPFNVEFKSTGGTTIKIGAVDVDTYADVKYPANCAIRLLLADFNISEATSYLDYEPYTRYEIYLPYYGYCQLPAEQSLGSRIQVIYNVALETGKSNVLVYNETKQIVLFTGECQLGCQIGLSGTNTLEIEKQKTAIALNTSVSAISGTALAVGAGMINPVLGLGALANTANSLTANLSQASTLFVTGNAKIGDPTNAVLLPQELSIRVTRMYPTEEYRKIKNLRGLPLNQVRTLNTLTGYTVVGDIHLENINTATSSELASIEFALKNGVIL